jgi:hypothetical protein
MFKISAIRRAAVLVVLFCGAWIAAAQETINQTSGDNLTDPRRLFVIPSAYVLKSFEVNASVGTNFGVITEEKRPFLGRTRIGLGDLAEVEISNEGIINRLSKGSPAIPTVAFKLQLLPEGRVFPAVAGALRSSLWTGEERSLSAATRVKFQLPSNSIKFEKRLATLYLVASKTIGPTSFHAGMSISDLRVRAKDAGTGASFSPDAEFIKANDRDYFNKNIFTPFAGLQAAVNDRTMLMMELSRIAEYRFDEDEPILDANKVTTRLMGIAGVRFFFFNWMALDTGVRYRSDFHGIGDAQIEAGLNFGLSLRDFAQGKGKF